MIMVLLSVVIIACVALNEIRASRVDFCSLFLIPALLLALAFCRYALGHKPLGLAIAGPLLAGSCVTLLTGAWRGTTNRLWVDSRGAIRRRGTAITLLAWFLSIVIQMAVGFMIFANSDQVALSHFADHHLLLAGLSLGAQGLIIRYRARHVQTGFGSKLRAKQQILVAAAVVSILGVGLLVVGQPRSYARIYLQPLAAKALAGLPPLAETAARRGFFIGAAVSGPEDGDAWSDAQATVGRDFNSITPENALKWGNLISSGRLGEGDKGIYNFREADEIVDFARARSARIRGHNLVWGRFAGAGYPGDLEEKLSRSPDAKAELRRILSRHISTVLGHFRGRIMQWDVVNEPLDIARPVLDNNIFVKTLGPDYIAECFSMAHTADPDAILFLNEQLDNYSNEHAQKLINLVESLVRSGVPIQGVGLQSHVLLWKPDLAALEVLLRRLDALGLQVEITELDVRVRLFSDSADPYQAQGAFIGDLIRTCLKVKAFRGLTFWGISDRHTWLDTFRPFQWMKPNDPLLLDNRLRRKPAYAALSAALR